MTVFHTGGEGTLVFGKQVGDRVCHCDLLAHHTKGVKGDTTGAQKGQRIAVHLNDGGF